MSERFKKWFLGACVIVPFLVYCIVYYAHVFKNAPYKFSEFKSFTMQWGPGDSLVNKYNSATGEYQFIDSRDSLVKMNVHLPKEELLVLHRKAAEQGLWDWPEVETGDTTERRNGRRAPRYVIQFNYKRKSKKVIFDESFQGDPRLKAANRELITTIQKALDDEVAYQEKNK
jgi:hypothetical protein